MASLVKTYKGDLTTFIAGKIWEFVKGRAKKGSQDVEDEEPTKQSGQPSSVSSVTSIVPVRKEGPSGLSRNVDPKTEKITNIINNLNDVINNPAAFPGEKENARDALKKYTKKLMVDLIHPLDYWSIIGVLVLKNLIFNLILKMASYLICLKK